MRLSIEDLRGGMVLARDDLVFPEGALDIMVFKGKVCACTRGGGFQLKLDQVLSAFSFHEATPEELSTPLVAGQFQIDDGPIYRGFHNYDRWNGWVKPQFELEQAGLIMAASGFDWWYYHGTDDTFYALWGDQVDRYEDYEGFTQFAKFEDAVIAFSGVDMRVADGRMLRLYGIGWGSWTWDLAAPPDKEEQ